MFWEAFPVFSCRGTVSYGMCDDCMWDCALIESVAKQLLVYSRNLFCVKSKLAHLCAVCSEKAVIETSRVAFLRVKILQLYREWLSNQHSWVLYSGLLDCWFICALIAPAAPKVVLKCFQRSVWDHCSFYANLLPERPAIYFALLVCERGVWSLWTVDIVHFCHRLSFFLL